MGQTLEEKNTHKKKKKQQKKQNKKTANSHKALQNKTSTETSALERLVVKITLESVG